MPDIRHKVMNLSEKYHMTVHLLFGLLGMVAVRMVFREESFLLIFLYTLLGSYLPDLDHFLFMFWYGKRSGYATIARKHFLAGEFEKLKIFCKENHKTNTGLYSHSFIFVFGALILAIYTTVISPNAIYSAFFTALFMHYLYDVIEDLVFFGKLNPNWLMRFNKSS